MPVCLQCGEENPEGARFCNACAAPLAVEAPAGVRKTVTVVFCDLVGSTTLGERTDPEPLRELMARYHAGLRTILELHGGTVEKFVGDAAMAVFGIPQAHEDDALRAVRSAAEARAAVAALGLEVRIGVNTGEVVAGSGETLVTGDAVNVAARLEQAAQAGEILLGEQTERLVRGGVRTESVEPFVLKGKAEPVPAFRLLELLPDVPAFTRPLVTSFVGRERELETLERTLTSAIEEHSPQLSTIVGPPGIGKSRLARELIQRSEARIVVGRCLSYGEGITYWPLTEVVSQVGDVRAVLGDDGDAELAASRIAAGLGTAETAASSEEIAWGFRKLLEALAREKPLIVVLDDIHWAEPTLLDLIEYISTFAQDAPLFLLCTARPDLFELRPAWATPKPNTTLVTLEPLAGSETETLVDELRDVPAETKARIVEAAEGNPLFVEQLLAMQGENGAGELEIPPTIQALLAARIDRLDPEERTVIECASIEGRMFHRGSVVELLPQQARAGVGSHLITLVRKEFIRPDRSQVPGDDGFRFGHILIRDTAYDSIPKRLRAELHERFVGWLESRLGDDAPGEIVGYHLEQAYRYRVELGPVADEGEALARRAAEHLRVAGERASARGDMAAASNLLGRTVELLPAEDPARLELMPNLGAALIEVGELARADSILEFAVEAAVSAGNQRVEWRARLGRATAEMWMGGSSDQAATVAEQATEALARIGDELGLARAWNLVALTRFWLGSTAVAEEAWRSALEHARRAGSSREEAQALSWFLIGSWVGPAPVEAGILRCREALADSPTRQVEAMALLGARPIARDAWRLRRSAEDVPAREGDASGPRPGDCGGGRLAGVLRHRDACRRSGSGRSRTSQRLHDSRAPRGEGFPLDARGLPRSRPLRAGRYEEAERFIEVSVEAGSADDRATQTLWRSARAKVTAAQGDFEAAERLAREAVEIVELTDWLNTRGDALVDLADVLRLAGRPAEARAPLDEAIHLFEQKGNVVAEQRARVTLGELQAKK